MLLMMHARQTRAQVDQTKIMQAQYELLIAEHNRVFHDNMQPATRINGWGAIHNNNAPAALTPAKPVAKVKR